MPELPEFDLMVYALSGSNLIGGVISGAATAIFAICVAVFVTFCFL